MAGSSKLVLIDGHALVYRAYFALPSTMATSRGELTNAVFGFASMLINVLRDENPDYLAVAFDVGRTFRHEEYAEYKANRAAMPDDLSMQFQRIHELLAAFHVPTYSAEGYEADDVLAALAQQAEKQAVDTLIVTGDTDTFQLIGPHVRVMAPRRSFGDTVIYDEEGIRQRYGLEPEQLIDYKALTGDTSDNVPGVRGVGDKTATKLLQEYGSVEGIYEHLDEVSSSRFRNALEEGRDMAFLSKHLVTIVHHVPVSLDLQACRVKEIDRERVVELFRELEFRALLNRLPGAKEGKEAQSAKGPAQLSLFGEEPPAEASTKAPAGYQIVKDMQALEAMVAELGRHQALVVDVETTSTDPMAARLVGIALTAQEGTGYYIPINHHPQSANSQFTNSQSPNSQFPNFPISQVVEKLKPLLQNPDLPKYAHNANYDLTALAEHGLEVAPLTCDTMVAEWLINPGSHNLGLKSLAWTRLGVEMTPIEKLIGSGKKQITMDRVPVAQAAPYACLNRDSLVLLSEGKTMKIGEIVNRRRSVQVLCMNERTSRIESKPVVNWSKRLGPPGQKWYKLITKYTQRSKWGTPIGPVFTPDHKVLTLAGWKTIVDLVPGDRVYTPEPQLSHPQIQLILGSCLGDGSLERRHDRLASFYVGHGEKQIEYIRFKASILENVMDRPERKASGAGRGRYENATDFWRIQTRCLRGIADLGDIMYVGGKKTITQDWLGRLDAIGFAFWYLDDGVLADSSSVRFIVHALSDEKVASVQAHLKEKWGFDSSLYRDKRKTNGLIIALTSSSSRHFFDLIAPYVHPSMQYKLPLDYQGRFQKGLLDDASQAIPYCEEIIEVVEYEPNQRGTYRMRYCIEVEDNHNFFTTTCLAKNCSDVDMTLRLANLLVPELHEKELWFLFSDVEMPLVPVIVDMQRAGVKLDVAALQAMSRQLNERLGELQEEIEGYVGHAININSTQQLSVALFDEMGLALPWMRRGASGHYSTAADVLEKLREKHPVVELILEHRQLSKLKGTYVDTLPELVNPRTGRVHTSYNQAGSVTGRFSSSNPNLQNIPIRTDIGREIRGAFVAEDGCLLLAADYSQVELRVLAHISQDPAMLAAFARGEDIHASTAAAIYGVPLAEVTSAQRRVAKMTNFAISYGVTGYGLSERTELSPDEAEEFIQTYFRTYPKIKAYIDHTQELARKQGYVETLLGRRRYFPELSTKSRVHYNVRQAAYRMAINAPVQGTAADILKVAMNRLWRELRARGLRSRMILQVHDELVLEVPKAELDEVAPLVIDTMEGAYQLDAPLKVDAKVGKNWLDMDEYRRR
jgi:DNA polymerase I-like protein with 3'-5' exonuclease and polymerase domains/5'-3' exonuclease